MDFDFDVLYGKTRKKITTNLEKEWETLHVKFEDYRQARLARYSFKSK